MVGVVVLAAPNVHPRSPHAPNRNSSRRLAIYHDQDPASEHDIPGERLIWSSQHSIGETAGSKVGYTYRTVGPSRTWLD